MNVLWLDNVPSFLDPSTDGAGGFNGSPADVGVPWFASGDGGVFSGQPVLWWDNGADSPSSNPSFSPVGGFNPGGPVDSWLPDGAGTLPDNNPSFGGSLLWTDHGSAAPAWLPTNSGAAQFGLGAADGPTSQWQQLVNDYAARAETWLANASTLLWTGGEPPITPPITGAPQLPTGSLLPSFTGVPAAQLVWGDPTHGLPAVISDPTAVGAPVTLGGLGIPSQNTGVLPPIGGAGWR